MLVSGGETSVSMDTTEAVDGNAIEPEPSMEAIRARHSVSEDGVAEEQRGSESLGLGDTSNKVAGNGSGAPVEFPAAGLADLEKVAAEERMSADTAGGENTAEDVGIVVAVVSDVNGLEAAVEAPSYEGHSKIETSAVTAHVITPPSLPHKPRPLVLPHDVIKDIVPRIQEVNESLAIEFLKMEQTEVVLSASIESSSLSAARMENVAKDSLEGPAFLVPISTDTLHVKSAAIENPAKLESGGVKSELEGDEQKEKHVAEDSRSVKLETTLENSNLDLSDHKFDKDNEAPPNDAGDASNRAEKSFEWELDYTLGEQIDEDFSRRSVDAVDCFS